MADILFVMKYPLNGQETLIPKFQGQMAAMERLGHRAWYLGWDEVGIWLCRDEEKTLVCRSRFSRPLTLEERARQSRAHRRSSSSRSSIANPARYSRSERVTFSPLHPVSCEK